MIFPRESLSLTEVLITYLLTNIIPVLIYLKYNYSNLSENESENSNKRDEVRNIINEINKLESKINKETLNYNKIRARDS